LDQGVEDEEGLGKKAGQEGAEGEPEHACLSRAFPSRISGLHGEEYSLGPTRERDGQGTSQNNHFLYFMLDTSPFLLTITVSQAAYGGQPVKPLRNIIGGWKGDHRRSL
jgi:hypothetical protein